jgi:hypothetical protein
LVNIFPLMHECFYYNIKTWQLFSPTVNIRTSGVVCSVCFSASINH